MMDTYRWVTNAGMAGVVIFIGLGILGMTGCSIQGDTYSGTVTQPDCSNANSGGGQLNCGSGDNTDDHGTEEVPAEE
jgi:hypothetical protein